MAGPELSIKTDARYRLRVGDDTDAGSLDRNEIGRLDYGVAARAGIAAGRVFIEGLYSRGFKDIGELREGQAQDLKTRALSVLAGIRF